MDRSIASSPKTVITCNTSRFTDCYLIHYLVTTTGNGSSHGEIFYYDAEKWLKDEKIHRRFSQSQSVWITENTYVIASSETFSNISPGGESYLALN